MARFNSKTGKLYGGKAGNCIMFKVKSHLKMYQRYKQITKMQSRDMAESTDRYLSSIKWYELMRSTLESWREMYPFDVEIVKDVYGLGDRKSCLSAVEASLKHHVSTSTIYSIRHSFELEIAFKAIQSGLLTVY